jgi:hypothetical protein
MSGGKPRLTDEQMRAVISAYVRADNNMAAAARDMNMPLGTYRSRLYKAREHQDKYSKPPAIDKPVFPDPCPLKRLLQICASRLKNESFRMT